MLFIRIGEGMSITLTYYSPSEDPRCKTNYKAKGKEFTFDRLGVEDSFYYEGATKLRDQVMQQIERVKESQERLANTREFNLGPRTIMADQKRIDSIVADLKAGKSFTYRPSGFGQGFVFSTSPRNSNRFERHLKASKELTDLVGKALYIQSMDCD
jgi:hypothetical protein